jgi:hypothetical protein
MIKMKKNLLYLCALTLLSGIFTGCSKDDDTEAPVVTILGDNPYKLAVGSVFNATNDPGATVSDNEDGDISDDLVPDYSELNLNANSDVTVELYNVLGKLVKTETFTSLNAGTNVINLDLAGFNAGLYTYSVTVGAEKLTRTLMVK